MHKPNPARYLVLIEAGGPMIAKLFDAERRLVAEIDGTSEEVAVMTFGLTPLAAGASPEWAGPLEGHNLQERAAAQVFVLEL
ncbi:hypothetical protein OOT46_08310 [Aquabacterium sp. A7-Y]|uniref:hypothetical protein n=1 Tax=Aquabacterium sp. A7-Y TaxID=1349605 RepID=UPI00223C9B30|nr:hypothetical protein [Aquabacterium sp. A7-Y]MCW7537850.1 hypothetical protein [Aquabacterium sp. A7-Y]